MEIETAEDNGLVFALIDNGDVGTRHRLRITRELGLKPRPSRTTLYFIYTLL